MKSLCRSILHWNASGSEWQWNLSNNRFLCWFCPECFLLRWNCPPALFDNIRKVLKSFLTKTNEFMDQELIFWAQLCKVNLISITRSIITYDSHNFDLNDVWQKKIIVGYGFLILFFIWTYEPLFFGLDCEQLAV